MMNLDAAIKLDSFLFLASLIVGVVFSLRQAKPLRLFLVLYVLATYSSYNIMVKPIHDFNLVVPRTLLFHYQFAGFLNFFDIVFIACCVYFALLKGKVRYPSSGIKLVVVRDGVVAFISLISFTFFYFSFDYLNIARWSDELRPIRGVFYFFGTLLIFSKMQSEIKVDFGKLIFIFITLDLINLASGFLSTLLYSNYTWERYGFNVSIIDQDDVYTFAISYFVLFVFWPFFPEKIKSRYYFFAAGLVTVLLFFNFYKFHYVAFVILFLIFSIIRSVNKKPPIIQVAGVLFLAALAMPVISYFYDSRAIVTRGGQLSDYGITMFSSSIYIPLFGMGNGGYYRIITDTSGDGGEVKLIDAEANPTVRKYIQFPLIQLVKPIGMVGLFLFVVFTSALGYKYLKKKSVNIDLTLFSILAYPILTVMLGPVLLSSIPNQSMVFFKCALLAFSYKKTLEKAAVPTKRK